MPLKSCPFLTDCAEGHRVLVALVVLCASIAAAPTYGEACKLAKMAEFPITMTNMRPLMTAKINDADVQFLVDSGAFYSMLSAPSASELKLSTYPAPYGFYLTGVGGGRADASITKVKVFTLAGVALHDVLFLVGGGEVGAGSIGVLGQNVLHMADVEYDLGQGSVRLMRPQDCRNTILAYWVDGTASPFSVIDIERTTPRIPQTQGFASINGTRIRVTFDTGAGNSVLSLRAAARVGIKPDSPGVVYAGPIHGIGKNSIPSYIAPFSSFKIGDEEIQNTRLRIADIDLPNADMLLGPDFFLSHRIYVANGQHKLYFTYNGGPVFNLAGAKYPQAQTDPASDASATESKAAGGEAEDAAAYSRRGTALAARQDFDHAIAALTRACELAPDHSEYFYQRAIVYRQMKQPALAVADLDQALKLKPDDLRALVSRAELLIQARKNPQAIADLNSADAVAPKQADERYAMAGAYARAELLPEAVAQYDLWIASHADDARLPEALNSRCWMRALGGAELALALEDCNAALKRAEKGSPLYAKVADSRGLVLLRMGEYDKSIADYDASLKINPRNAWSLYGRGIDELRKHKAPEGQADIAQATAAWAGVAAEFNRRGIAP
jgi:tetratricopeptide (TPR) repeat protein